jgi:LAGLIDADG DNA endonuclease family
VGNTEGRLLVVETLFARNARTTPLTGVQRDLVIGSLLGDGYLMPTTAGWCFRVSHGMQQRSYVDWKFGIISDLVRTAPRASGRSYYFRTVTHPDFSGLREAFYAPGAAKGVPLHLIERELTAFGLAIWFMDDGAADRNQLRLNTQSFSRDENLVLAEFLQAKFGIAAQLNKDKDRHRLRIGARGMDRFLELVAPHVIPSMLYKLPL